jgi:hypothetical protein
VIAAGSVMPRDDGRGHDLGDPPQVARAVLDELPAGGGDLFGHALQ